MRVVNSTVTSARVGSDGSEVPTQTYRIDGDGEAVTTGANKVGGEQPIDADASANSGSDTLAALQASASQYTQSIVTVDTTSGDVSGINFGYNFDTIVNTNDAGQGSLRQFILNANLLTDNASLAQSGLTAGAETSIFMIPGTGDALGRPADPQENFGGNTGGEFTIQPTSALPALTDQLTYLDATNQSGFSGQPFVEIDGSLAGLSVDGLAASSNNNRFIGLVINRFDRHGINLTVGGSCAVYGNYIGTDVTGIVGLGNNGHGIYIDSSTTNSVGGPLAGQRNVIAANGQSGVRLTNNANINFVVANYIGTNASGTAALGNARGIDIDAANNTIGGTGAGNGNVISGNTIRNHHEYPYLRGGLGQQRTVRQPCGS